MIEFSVFLAFIIQFILIFMLGASLASFLAAMAYRIESEMRYPEIFTKGSHCESCGKELRWFELVPVLSYIFFHGKCSVCQEKIQITYLGSEVTLGSVALLLYYFHVDPIIYVWVLSLSFLGIYDALYHGIPKKVMHIYLAVGGIWLLGRLAVDPSIALLYPTLIAITLFLFVESVNKYKVIFGTGDTLLLLYLATITEIEVFLGTLFIALLVGGVAALILLVLKVVKRGSYIPFMPFIGIGYISAVIMWSEGVSVFDYIYLMW